MPSLSDTSHNGQHSVSCSGGRLGGGVAGTIWCFQSPQTPLKGSDRELEQEEQFGARQLGTRTSK